MSIVGGQYRPPPASPAGAALAGTPPPLSGPSPHQAHGVPSSGPGSAARHPEGSGRPTRARSARAVQENRSLMMCISILARGLLHLFAL